jgi:hypothetical protein
MSTHERLRRRAFLRSRVLLEPYHLAYQHVIRTNPGDSVVPTAATAQARLEGAVFNALGYIRPIGGGAVEYRVRRLLPAERSLEVWLTASSEPYPSGLVGALPTWYTGDGTLANGHPGLRYRLVPGRRGSVEFFLLHNRCSLLLHGVDAAAFDQACRTTTREDDLHGATTGRILSAAERNDINHRAARDADALISPLVRRLGALGTDELLTVDLWRTNHDVLSVEMFTTDRSEQTFHRRIATLTSLDLAPRMRVLKTDGAAGYRTVLAVDGHSATLHLRVQTSHR